MIVQKIKFILLHIILTACNKDTESFPIELNSFTRLYTPRSIRVAPENITTSSMVVTWQKVDQSDFYLVRYKKGLILTSFFKLNLTIFKFYISI